MKTLTKICACAVVLVMMCSAGFGQGAFQNLDFESPIVPLVPDSNGRVPIANALPHWNGYFGSDQQTTVLYNDLYLGTATLALLGPGHTSGVVIDGQYTAVLQPGLGSSGHVSAAIRQNGQIPNDARSIEFLALFSGASVLNVSFANQPLSLLPLGAGPNGSTIFGADISAFAGLNGELRFTAPDVSGFPNYVFLDDISFSPQVVPEPGVFGLFALGSLLLGRRMRHKAR